MRTRIAIVISFITVTLVALTLPAMTTSSAEQEPPSSRSTLTTSAPIIALDQAALRAQRAATTTTTTVPPTTTTTAPPVTTTTQPVAPVAVAPAPAPTGSAYEQWTRVAVCEEGGWVGSSGSAYPNSLGITAQNWYANGGGSDVSPEAQIAVAERLVASLGMPGWVPDQNGCASW